MTFSTVGQEEIKFLFFYPLFQLIFLINIMHALIIQFSSITYLHLCTGTRFSKVLVTKNNHTVFSVQPYEKQDSHLITEHSAFVYPPAHHLQGHLYSSLQLHFFQMQDLGTLLIFLLCQCTLTVALLYVEMRYDSMHVNIMNST